MDGCFHILLLLCVFVRSFALPCLSPRSFPAYMRFHFIFRFSLTYNTLLPVLLPFLENMLICARVRSSLHHLFVQPQQQDVASIHRLLKERQQRQREQQQAADKQQRAHKLHVDPALSLLHYLQQQQRMIAETKTGLLSKQPKQDPITISQIARNLMKSMPDYRTKTQDELESIVVSSISPSLDEILLKFELFLKAEVESQPVVTPGSHMIDEVCMFWLLSLCLSVCVLFHSTGKQKSNQVDVRVLGS